MVCTSICGMFVCVPALIKCHAKCDVRVKVLSIYFTFQTVGIALIKVKACMHLCAFCFLYRHVYNTADH